jgi:hypothetical protein
LKKYRFDYLIFPINDSSIVFRVVCYIEEFDIDATFKMNIETIPKNINFDKSINQKIETVINNFMKVYFLNYRNKKQIEKLQ